MNKSNKSNKMNKYSLKRSSRLNYRDLGGVLPIKFYLKKRLY